MLRNYIASKTQPRKQSGRAMIFVADLPGFKVNCLLASFFVAKPL